MQETLTFPTLGSPPARFTFPELQYAEHNVYCSELSSSTSTPFVSAPSSPTTRSKGFYFGAPPSPTTLLSPPKQGLHPPSLPLHTPPSPPHEAAFHMQDSSQQTLQVYFTADSISSLQASSHCSNKTEHHSSPSGSHISLQTDHTSGSNWAQQSLQHNSTYSCSQKSLQIAHHERISSWAPQSLQTEHHRSSPWPLKPYQAEYERSPDWAQHSLETEHNSTSFSSHKSLQTHHGRSPSWAQQTEQHSSSSWSQKALQTERARSPLSSQASLEIKDLHITNSNLTHNPQPIITDFANHKALKTRQVEDVDASYSRKGFYASAVPFSWEEKPGTPKARSVTSEASNGEDDSLSNLLSGSSEFEFSARFSELEDPPMSPTPISSTFHSFKHQYAYDSPSPTHKHVYSYPHMPSETANEQQIWPLRPPPRLDNPVLPMKQLTKNEANELKRSYGSLASLSAPQSPRSPRKFDIRGALCGISSPVDAVFDPFLAAMEKSMAKNGDDLGNEEMGKGAKKNTSRHGHHRRSQSLSPLRVFHWDDHSAKSNSSSNGSSSMDVVKNKHPIQREINARHSAGTPKGSKRWSFKGLLHRKSISGGENTRHSNTSGSLRSSGRESCSSSGKGEVLMDVSYMDENIKVRGANTPINNNPSMPASIPSTPSSILSPSSSNNSSRGKLNTHMKANKGPYALHYGMQRAHTEDLRKKTFLPYRQGLLGCLGLSSKSYRALATLSKPLQSVS